MVGMGSPAMPTPYHLTPRETKMTEIDLARLESTLVDESAYLLNDLTYDRHRIMWRLYRAQVTAMEAEIGVRLTRFALRKADFRPVQDEPDDWEASASIASISRLWPCNTRKIFGLRWTPLICAGGSQRRWDWRAFCDPRPQTGKTRSGRHCQGYGRPQQR